MELSHQKIQHDSRNHLDVTINPWDDCPKGSGSPPKRDTNQKEPSYTDAQLDTRGVCVAFSLLILSSFFIHTYLHDKEAVDKKREIQRKDTGW